MNKLTRVKIQNILRKLKLLSTVEKGRYYWKVAKNRRLNNQFRREFPNFILPPAHLAFDAYSAPQWYHYKETGEKSGLFLKNVIKKYIDHPTKVYEWGCGPSRIIRHLPSILDAGIKVFGSDYNKETIEWCRENISGIHFDNNELLPPLPYPDNNFDFAYAISVFTHLSEEAGHKWTSELYRILNNKGVLLITTNSVHSYQTELLESEKNAYNTKGIVVRGNYEEGKKMFLTFHNPDYIRKVLLEKFEVLEYTQNGFPMMKQDCWIARKK
ncbi:MAG TPA: class I SAM-dependent methyltransferase [Agriterribacter sp.]|nr:class I SAM-dependent methyltransferase [Agriterribacter sp.]HRQ49339.1 class I SAM-dependent methyltransferase [Agriterribacter sp.]